jgi:hypothetical protein
MTIYSVSCDLSAAPGPVGTGDHQSCTGTDPDRPIHVPTGTGTYRHRPAWTGLDRHKTGTDRSGYFYDVFDTHFVLNSPKRYDILKILIKNVIKQSGHVGAGLCRCRLVPVGVGRRRGLPAPTSPDRHASLGLKILNV